jgi:hypothetical protein
MSTVLTLDSGSIGLVYAFTPIPASILEDYGTNTSCSLQSRTLATVGDAPRSHARAACLSEHSDL